MVNIGWVIRGPLAVTRDVTVAIGILALAVTLVTETRAQSQRGGPSAADPGASVYFIDLKDGAIVPPKFTVHFGLKGMGIAPAGMEREHAGHHHLLIDVETPPFDEPIPNDPNHLHFGAGQTEAEVSLPPGQHTLQLLLGDKNHIPHSPPVVSERIRITVADPSQQQAAAPASPAPGTSAQPTRKPSPPGAKVYFVYPRNGATIPPNIVVRFGLLNMGVAPAGVARANTGHHHLLIDTPVPALNEPIPNDPNHLHFGGGQTEAQVKIPLGNHTLQLLLADENHVPHDPPVMSDVIRIHVVSKLPKRSVGRQRYRR